MKKLIMTLCGAAMIGVASLAQAQDSTSTDYRNQSTLEQPQAQPQDPATPTQDQPTLDQPTPPAVTPEQPVQDGNNQIRQGQSRESGQPTQDQVDQSMERPNEMTPVEGKLGPKGETIFRENDKYYYIDDKGEKVGIQESELQSKPK